MPPEPSSIWGLPWGPILIFGLRIVDVSIDTIRVLFTVRGKRSIAPLLGFFQALIWIFAVGHAIKHLDSGWHIVAYAAGYATGSLLGITIEQALAYGLSTVRIVSLHAGVKIAETLRERGFGVTEMSGQGRQGRVEIVNSVVLRRQLGDVLSLVDRCDPAAFVTVDEPRVLRGGFYAEGRSFDVPGFWERFGRQRA